MYDHNTKLLFNIKYNLPMVVHWINCLWLSIRAFGFLTLHSCIQQPCDNKHWNYKVKMNSSLLKNPYATTWKTKQAISLRNHRYHDRYKTGHYWNIQKGHLSQFCVNIAAFWWRQYVGWYLKEKEKIWHIEGGSKCREMRKSTVEFFAV